MAPLYDRIKITNERAKAIIQKALQCKARAAQQQQITKRKFRELDQRIEHLLSQLADIAKQSPS